jgi:hypothetical protein
MEGRGKGKLDDKMHGKKRNNDDGEGAIIITNNW